MLKKIIPLLPLLFFGLLLAFLWRGLSLDPKKIPTALTNKPAPTFELDNLLANKTTLSNRDFLGHVSLLNVWASWCESCKQDQTYLMRLHASHVVLFGLNYKDQDHNAEKWLQQFGNPYEKVGVDRKGMVAIDWGVYGTPELFIIDKQGRIRGKHVGMLSETVLQQTLYPLIKQLNQEGV